MFFRNSSKVLGFLGNFKAKYSIGTNGQRNSKYVLENQRNFGTKSDKDEEHHPEHEDCPNKSCEKKPKKKSMLWGLLTGKPEKIKVCSSDEKALVITTKPNLNWAPAYRMEKDLITVEATPEPPIQNKKEEILQEEPMPDFTTVEQRWLDLSERKLHPYYRVYQSIPKKHNLGLPERPFYKTRSGPVSLEEIPENLKIKQDVFIHDPKFGDIKKAEVPQQMVAKMAEIRKNARATLGPDKLPIDVRSKSSGDRTKDKTVFDTLYQDTINKY